MTLLFLLQYRGLMQDLRTAVGQSFPALSTMGNIAGMFGLRHYLFDALGLDQLAALFGTSPSCSTEDKAVQTASLLQRNAASQHSSGLGMGWFAPLDPTTRQAMTDQAFRHLDVARDWNEVPTFTESVKLHDQQLAYEEELARKRQSESNGSNASVSSIMQQEPSVVSCHRSRSGRTISR